MYIVWKFYKKFHLKIYLQFPGQSGVFIGSKHQGSHFKEVIFFEEDLSM